MEVELKYGFIWIYFGGALAILILGYRFFSRHYQFIEIPPLPRWRRFGFYISLAVFCLIFALTPYYLQFRLSLPLTWSMVVAGLFNVFTANVVVELQRIIMRSGLAWSNTRHAIVLLLWWLVLMVVDGVGLLMGKQKVEIEDVEQLGSVLLSVGIG